MNREQKERLSTVYYDETCLRVTRVFWKDPHCHRTSFPSCLKFRFASLCAVSVVKDLVPPVLFDLYPCAPGWEMKDVIQLSAKNLLTDSVIMTSYFFRQCVCALNKVTARKHIVSAFEDRGQRNGAGICTPTRIITSTPHMIVITDLDTNSNIHCT